jgi:GH18 family chitinase
LVSDVTHVALAFMRSEIFIDKNRTEWPLFTTTGDVRQKFANGTVVQVAIGGWGNTAGFEFAAKTESSRKMFAQNVKAMLDATGADGVDIDWEYPG